MDAFDFDRLQEVRITKEEDHVYPYAFWVWPAANGRRGGMVCFRGECRRGPEGEQDVRVIGWWMGRYVREAGRIDGLVVDTWEFFGGWHDRLTFLPPGKLPASFQVLYSVLPHHWERALELWGRERVRDNLDAAMAEMDRYLLSLRARK